MLNQESLRAECAPIRSSTANSIAEWCIDTFLDQIERNLTRLVRIGESSVKTAERILAKVPSLPVVRSSFSRSLPFAAAMALVLTLSASSVNLASAQSMVPKLTGSVGDPQNQTLFQDFRAKTVNQTDIRAQSFWEPAGTFKAQRNSGFSTNQTNQKQFYRKPGTQPGIYTETKHKEEPHFSLPSSSSKKAVDASSATKIGPVVLKVLEKGSVLENENRWNEALTVYQNGLKKNPNNPKILARRQFVRIHVDLASRLADKTYVQSVKADSAVFAKSAFEEILANIQAYHYAKPNWNNMLQHGVQNLTEAMKNKAFQKAFAPIGYETKFHSVVKQIENHKKGIFVRNRNEYVQLVDSIAKLAEAKCGLRQSVTIFEFACSSISSLDTYSSYMAPESYEDLRSRLNGRFVGIGVEIHITDRHLEVVKVFPGGPADDARIRAEDKILAVNGHRVSKVGGNPAADLLKGTEGSQLTVLVETPDKKEYLLRMKRRHIEVSSISKAAIVDRVNGVGYIQLSSFQENSVYEFDSAMMKLHRQGMKSLVLDLRDNPGGVLKVGIKIANRFLQKGRIVVTRGRSNEDNKDYHAELAGTWNLPMVVLIDENSASASEIVAAAIAENRRGQVVGKRSYGKGTVQGIFTLVSGRGGLRLTTAKFYSPTGREISYQGVQPTSRLETVAKIDREKGKENKRIIFGSKDDKVFNASVRMISRNNSRKQTSARN